MEEKPRVVITSRARRVEPAGRGFAFTKDMIPQDSLADYRQRAWEVYNRLPLPASPDEAWRRTDLRPLPADIFRLPEKGEFRNLPAAPEELLKPLTADRQGGQVVLLPGGSRASLDPALVSKGVFFTDLRTALVENPRLVSRMTGELVRPEEGKFAALAGAYSQNGVVLYVPKGLQIEEPLNSLVWGPGAALAHGPTDHIGHQAIGLPAAVGLAKGRDYAILHPDERLDVQQAASKVLGPADAPAHI